MPLVLYWNGCADGAHVAHSLPDMASQNKRDLASSSLYLASGLRSNSASNTSDSLYSDPSSWHCPHSTIWKDLGPNHYPRFIQEVMCGESTCIGGFYQCRSSSYQVPVLARKNNALDAFYQVVRLPLELRSAWTMKYITVSTYCFCGEV